jgi:pantoate--beta-alanine ligase
MLLLKTIEDLQQYLDKLSTTSIGFVPTMGALHQGHISLIAAAKENNDCIISSIFVNPTQFNNATDFQKYPITIEQDIYALETAGCNVLFLPSVQEMYPSGIDHQETYDLGFIETILEGEFRPGHFQGVCIIVDKLLKAVQPTDVYLGRKDYQQCMVIQKLLSLKKYTITLHICDTLREESGLAMSSRNMRLSAEQKNTAVHMYKNLQYVKENIQQNNIAELVTIAITNLINAGFNIDYFCVADGYTLQPINQWDGKSKLVVLAAAFLGDIRLIDNLVI